MANTNEPINFNRVTILDKSGMDLEFIRNKINSVLKPNKTYLIKISENRSILYEEYRFLKWFGANNDLLLFAKIANNVKESFSIYDIGEGSIRIKEV